MNLNDLTLLTCSFNNNALTSCMLMSLYKQLNKNMPRVVIMDNSTITPCTPVLKEMCTVIDNTYYNLTKDYKQISRNHSASIDYALKNCISTKYVLLCDNDILFKSAIANLLSSLKDVDAVGLIENKRLLPYFCIINLEKMKTEHINYFDENNCTTGIFSEVDKDGFWLRDVNTRSAFLDTGGSFLNEIKNWNVTQINIYDYAVHMQGSAWCKRDLINNFLTKYKYLYA